MRDRTIDVLTRALFDHRSVEVNEIDAILVAVCETGQHRARYQLGDPYVEERARFLDILGRLRAELADRRRVPDQLPTTPPAKPRSPLGVRIRVARREAGLTQLLLAEKLEVTQTTIGRWEAGVMAPNDRHRMRLADLLGGRPTDYEE
ncbi:MAG: helix-turn-helix domain-containing protein [Acidimicrobiaceae bacterium]|nr:helix-turn-helix domain-containing protein [Acidimicrobiaceae bacterium]